METKRKTTARQRLSFWDAVRKASDGLPDNTIVQVRYPGLHGYRHVDAVAAPRFQIIACEDHHLPIEFLYHRKWEIVKPEDKVLIETDMVTFEEAFAALLVGKIVGQRNRTETYRLRGNYKVVDPMQAGRTMSFVFRQEEINATDWIIYGDW